MLYQSSNPVVESRKGSLCTLAHRYDYLFIRNIGNIAGGINTRYRCPAKSVGLYFLAWRKFQLTFKRLAVCSKSNLYKNSVKLYDPDFFSLTVFIFYSRNLIYVSDNFHCLHRSKNLYIIHACRLILQHSVGPQLIGKFYHSYLRAYSG